MLHIDIIAVGSIRETFFREASLEYLKRNKKYYHIQVIEIKEEPIPSSPSPKQILECIEKEAGRIQDNLKINTYSIGLSPSGKKVDSAGLAEILEQLSLKGFSHCTFIIGGSYGLPSYFLQNCHLNLSFSELTFPHQLFRVILLEQLFRSAKIIQKETYHK